MCPDRMWKLINFKSILEFSAELRQKYSDLGIQIKATSPNEILKELNEISERENKLRLEGNNQNKLKASQLSKLGKEQDSLFFKIKALNNAEQNFQEQQACTVQNGLYTTLLQLLAPQTSQDLLCVFTRDHEMPWLLPWTSFRAWKLKPSC